jgi:hypothetical protein
MAALELSPLTFREDGKSVRPLETKLISLGSVVAAIATPTEHASRDAGLVPTCKQATAYRLPGTSVYVAPLVKDRL